MIDDEARMVPGADNRARLWRGQPSLIIIGSVLAMMALAMSLAETAARLLTRPWTKGPANRLS